MQKYLLWTGGWDSTYRLVELSRMDNMEVYPVYVIDHTRASLEKEIEAMNSIYDALEKDSRTKAKLNPIKMIDENDIKPNEVISEAYKRLKCEIRLGTQYDYLARLAVDYPGIEIGIEKPHGEFSGCVSVIETFGKMRNDEGVNRVDPAQSSEDLKLVFGNFSFPLWLFAI